MVYRYNFPSIDTYTDFVGANSLTNIVNNTFAFAQEADVITYTEITGDVIMKGDLTVENIIVGSTNIITEINTKQNIINDDDLTIPKILNLQSSLNTLQTNIDLNTTNILTKQDLLGFSSVIDGFNVLENINFSNPDDTLYEYLDYSVLNALRLRTETFDTTLTANDIECNSLKITQLEVNGGVNINTSKYFDTMVIRRPTGITGIVDDYRITLRELQCWVNGVNIMINNGLTSYFTFWTNKGLDYGFTNASTLAYNNTIESTTSTDGAVSLTNNINDTLIIKNIPLTSINTIQSIVYYNRVVNGTGNRAIGLAVELYNSINDPDLTEVLATTNEITSNMDTYRFDFPSLSTYTGFVGEDSITNIVNNTFALAEDAIFTDYAFDITGDVLVAGNLTASSAIVNGVNINTTLTDILSRLTALENP